jgi:polysaccharide biosynthesis transport protein
MSENEPGVNLVRADARGLAVTNAEPLVPAPGIPRSPFDRPIAAVLRYKWLVLGVLAAATAIGLIAARLVKPEYEVRATIWIQPDRGALSSGPIRSQELLKSSAWVELLRSYRITDAVVRKTRLYIAPDRPSDLRFFPDFAIQEPLVAGEYLLELDAQRKRWRLTLEGGSFADSGGIGDSVGVRAGIRWTVPSTAFESGVRSIRFTMATPREVAIGLATRMTPRLPEGSNFLGITLHGDDPQRTAHVLNTWLKEYVDVATELKRRNVDDFATILNGQLQFAEQSLRDSERALETFRIRTINLPSEGGPVAAGLEVTRDPAFSSFFNQRIQYDDLRNDREALEQVMNGARNGTLPWEAALLIPTVSQSAGADALRSAFRQLQERRAELTVKRQSFTDDHPDVRELATIVRVLETQTLPQLASQLLAQLRQRESEQSRRIASASQELRAIPARTIEEMRLRRSVTVAEGLYTTLKTRSAEAALAQASSSPDVAILDSAVAPLYPSRNTAPRLLLMVIAGGLAAGLTLAFLLDAFDKKIRYPEQVTAELGLPIGGTIPLFPKGRVSSRSPDQLAQLVESVRTIRMHVQHSIQQPFALAVTSPAPGDGKSFLATNLALSFADAGYRTILVDADTRRGRLHEAFEIPVIPGLTEHLGAEIDINSVVRATYHESLSLITRGKHAPNTPELLTSTALPDFTSRLLHMFDVVIFDTPPLAAGIDAYAVAASARNAVLVLRVGRTERRLAAAKLELVDRLPIRMLSAVLNAVKLDGEFKYYRYAEGYHTHPASENGEQSAVVATTRT